MIYVVAVRRNASGAVVQFAPYRRGCIVVAVDVTRRRSKLKLGRFRCVTVFRPGLVV